MSDLIKIKTCKTFTIRTYGCQMNEYDTELVRSILSKEGFGFVDDVMDADVVMLNTCSVRENAHRKVYGHIHALRHKKNGNPVMIGILGCMATSLRKDLLEDRHLNIDFIAGPDSYKRLPDLIRQTAETGKKAFDVTLSEFETYSDVYPSRTDGVNPSTSLRVNPSTEFTPNIVEGLRVNAWLAIMRGCNNFCTFCVVPYTRGRERSRSIANIVEEVRKIAEEGFQQVTLLGQNVNSYRHDNASFADLLEEVSKVEGIKRIRFTSPHPKDFPDKLIDVISGNDKVCKHIHLPLQAGNNRILDLMNRTYTREEFIALVNRIRQQCPGIVLTTDIIAGFPTETDEEFEDTVAIMKEVGFDAAFIFKYSPRQGTLAERKYTDDVPEEKKTKRTVRLNALQQEISLKKNQALIGKVLDILIESQGTHHSPDDLLGRTDGNKLVTLKGGNYSIGQFVRVKITDATPHGLKGKEDAKSLISEAF